jgi:hypothetical protein
MRPIYACSPRTGIPKTRVTPPHDARLRFSYCSRRPKLSENNKGLFPASRVYDVIDGRIEVMQHGRRDMPVWGDIYTSDLIIRLPRDSLSKEAVEAMVRVRILTLVEYISTLQGK